MTSTVQDPGLPPLAVPHLPVLVKPLLRGVSHQVAFFVALVAGGLLVWAHRSGPAWRALAVFAVCQAALFGISAAYHRPTWSPVARARMRRLDHVGIYLQIAGSYTPVCVLGMGGEAGDRLLAWVWAGAGLGIVKTLFWVHAPKPISAGLYVLLGWAVMSEWSAITAALGSLGTALMLIGGALYTVGALIYALKRPNPWPRTFGYHEIFHLLVVAAAMCHFEMVRRVAG